MPESTRTNETQADDEPTAATGPKDTVSGKVRETPDEPGDRPGTEAEEARR